MVFEFRNLRVQLEVKKESRGKSQLVAGRVGVETSPLKDRADECALSKKRSERAILRGGLGFIARLRT